MKQWRCALQKLLNLSRVFEARYLSREAGMSLLLLILILVLLFGGVGTYPRWGYSSGWGYGPSGILGLIR
jgi:hypothetical protein